MKKIIYSMCIILSVLSLIGCGKSATKTKEVKTTPKEKEKQLDIITTNRFVYNITKEIVKDNHIVEYIFNENRNNFDDKYTKDSLNNIDKQDLFIYSGVDLEVGIDEFISKLKKNKVGIVNLSRGAKIIPYETSVKYEDKEFTQNPYYWGNIDNYKIMLLNIKNAIGDKDPKNRDEYEKNFYDSMKKLDELEKEISEIKDGLKEYVFLIKEDGLDYFTQFCEFNTIKLKQDNNDKDKEADNENKDVDNKNNDNKDVNDNDPNKKIENIINENKDKKIVFLQGNEKIDEYQNTLNKDNIKIIKVNLTDYKEGYYEFMKKNIDMFKSLIDENNKQK